MLTGGDSSQRRKRGRKGGRGGREGGSTLVRRAMPPGRSETVAIKRMRRPSAANPRSMTRPSIVISREEGGREGGRAGGRQVKWQ